MKNFFIIGVFLIGFFSFSQRPFTGQKIFKKKYPVEQINKLTNASLLVSNTLNEDINVCLTLLVCAVNKLKLICNGHVKV